MFDLIIYGNGLTPVGKEALQKGFEWSFLKEFIWLVCFINVENIHGD